MSKKHENVMVDLETLGTAPGCTILSIGAVAFGPGEIGLDGFHTVISRGDCRDHGLMEDSSTLAWWIRQHDKGADDLPRRALSEDAEKLVDALIQFSCWVAKQTVGWSGVKIWGNGADFDLPILAAAFRAVGDSSPWGYRHGRCYRTLMALHPLDDPARSTRAHDALSDAVAQAHNASRVLKILEISETPSIIVATLAAMKGADPGPPAG